MIIFTVAGTLQIIGTAAASVAAVLGLIIPIYKKAKKRMQEEIVREESIATFKKQSIQNEKRIDSIEVSLSTILQNQDAEKKEDLEREIRTIKVYINMIYYSYNNIADVPNEMFINGFNLCERYLKLGQNHEMKPICENFKKEYDKRIKNRII